MMKKAKNWLKLMEQRKKDNTGASIILTIVVVALLCLMVSVLFTVSFYNYRMKTTGLKAKETFYTAETAMDEIRVGLRQDVSEAFAMAYTESMESYIHTNVTERNALFKSSYVRRLESRLMQTGSMNKYNIEYLRTFLKKTKFDDSTNTGAKLNITDNILEKRENGIILKNVVVKYYEKQGYVSEIQTDIVLEIPNIDFSQLANPMEFMNYGLIANESMEVSGSTVNVAGSAYIGKKGAYFDANSVVNFRASTANSNDLLITNGSMNALKHTNLMVSDMEIWAQNIVADSSPITFSECDTFVSNDVVVNNSAKTSPSITMSGSFYGYGSPNSAAAALSMQEHSILNDINQHPSEYSSAILVNGSNAKVDLSGLASMKIAGNSYVAASKKNNQSGEFVTNEQNEDIEMGESISVKSNQTAYLVPPSSVYGGMNPMTAQKYQEIQQELEKDPAKKLVDRNSIVQEYGTTLADLNVDDWKVVCYPVQNLGSMVCVFMEFDSVGSANAFFTKYYANSQHLTKLKGNLNTYTPYGLELPDDLDVNASNNTFYYNGNIVVNEQGNDTSFYVNKTATPEESADMHKEQADKWDDFAALNKCLSKDHSNLSKTGDVYSNLIQKMTSTNVDKNISQGDKKVFVTSGADPFGTVIVNNAGRDDYEITANTVHGYDALGTSVNQAQLRVVIASGNVRLNLPPGQNYKGIIIAGGKIIADQASGIGPQNIEAAPADVAVALKAANADGIKPLMYVAGFSSESEAGGASSTGGVLSMADLVVYQNWKKQ